MNLILNIDTALETASVCLSEDGNMLQISFSENQKDHASWLHSAIADLFKKSGYDLKALKAVSVSTGPGSYTGLRVGMSAAKGICYALNIPMITMNSLKILAFAVKGEAVDKICPLIDARRMEVYTAMYDKDLQEQIPPHALVADEKSFASSLLSGKVLFCGNGVKKLQPILSDRNAFFSPAIADASHLGCLSYKIYQNKEFANLAYAEPLYLK